MQAAEVSAEFDIGGMPQSRFMAIFHTAIHDAAIAAWDAQVAHARPSPAATSDEITPAAGVDPARSSFPSEHAAVAGAAAAVLAYLIPDAEAGRFDALATEAAESRIAAGAAFPSDVEAGLALGQAVGEKAVERAKADGADAEWDPATRPTGPGYLAADTAGSSSRRRFSPMAGAQKTWVMTSGDQFRPAPPPEYGSPAWEAELTMVQELAANRSFEQERAALWWADHSPPALINGWTHELIRATGSTRRTPRRSWPTCTPPSPTPGSRSGTPSLPGGRRARSPRTRPSRRSSRPRPTRPTPRATRG